MSEVHLGTYQPPHIFIRKEDEKDQPVADIVQCGLFTVTY